MARTSGGLIKRNFQFTQQQIERIAQTASEMHASEAAAVRELLDFGWRVYQRRKATAGPLEELVTDLVAREVA